MEDKILQKFFEHDRWVYAIEKGVDKDINKADLYQLSKPEVRVKMCEAIRQGQYEIARRILLRFRRTTASSELYMSTNR